MFTTQDLKQTRFYQDVVQEGIQLGKQQGIQQGEITLTLRLLRRRLGSLTDESVTRIRALPIEQLENLGEALLDFQSETDLQDWFAEVSGSEIEA